MTRRKVVDGFENYEVTDNGFVYNRKTGHRLKNLYKSMGYYQVCLYDKNHKRSYKFIHRLVAFAFCDGYKDGYVVNHKNGVMTDNRSENLEWCTQEYNLKHAYNTHLTPFDTSSKRIVATDMETGGKTIYKSIHNAAKTLGISQGNICMCCQNKRPYANGFYWSYL